MPSLPCSPQSGSGGCSGKGLVLKLKGYVVALDAYVEARGGTQRVK